MVSVVAPKLITGEKYFIYGVSSFITPEQVRIVGQELVVRA